MGDSQRVIRGVSSQALVTIVLGIVEIVSFSIMSRLLSQQDFGYYAAIVAVSTIFSSLAENGIGAAIVQKKDLDDDFVNNSFTLSCIIGITISGLLCFCSGYLAKVVADETMQIPLMLYSATLLLSCITSVNISLMQRELMFVKIGVINFTSLVITTIVAILLAMKGFGYYAILTKALLTSALTAIISLYAVRRKYEFTLKMGIIKRILSFSGWLMASSLFRNFANQIDKLLMSSLFSVMTLGMYSRPKEFISNMTGKCNTIFDTTLFPILSRYQDNKEQLRQTYIYTLYFLNIIGMLFTIVFFINSELFIRIFFGEEWLNVNSLFKVLSFSAILFINGRIGDIFLRSLGLTRSQFFFRIGQLVLTVVFVLLSYSYGIISVAVGALSAYFCIVVMKIFYISSKIGLSLNKSFLTVLNGCRFALFFVPFYFLCRNLIAHSWKGNILQLILCVLYLMFLFSVPNIIGKMYKEIAFIKILQYKTHVLDKIIRKR